MELNENFVKAIHEDISKVVANQAKMSPDEVGVMYVRCHGSWDMAINIIYIMKKKNYDFAQAVSLYREFTVKQLKARQINRKVK